MSQHSVAPRLRMFVVTAVIAALTALTMMVVASGADAANFPVSGNGPAATDNFIAAVALANASTTNDTITFTGTNPIVEPGAGAPNVGQIVINKPTGTLTIGSPAGPGVTFDGTVITPPQDTVLAISAGSNVTLFNATFTNSGDSIHPSLSVSGTINVNNSTIAGNTGPGVNVKTGGNATFTNSTISDGLATGVIVSSGATASFADTTVTANTGTGIANAAGSTLNLANTIVSSNGNGSITSNCSRPAASAANSLSNTASNATQGCGSTVTVGSANLGDLTLDGGITQTHPLLNGSAAIGAGNALTCAAGDQRGISRGAVCDIGAAEFTPPTITVPGAITVQSNTATAVTYTATAASTVDTASVSCTPASGSSFAVGTTTVNCTATDTHGRTATGSFTVLVNAAPVIAAQSNKTAEATGPSGATVTYGPVTTTDANDGPGTATCSPASGTTFAIATTTVTCNASDTHGGNAAPVTFTVKVQDTTAPLIASITNKTVDSQSTAGAVVSFTPSVTEAVGGGSTTCVPASGSTFPIGTTTVTCNAVDGAGNHATPVSFTVTVVNVISLAPATETGDLTGTSKSVTATVIEGGAPLVGKSISFAVTGANTASGNVTTDAAGKATFSYVGTSAGSDTIKASFLDAGEQTQSASATKTWISNQPPVAKLSASPTTGAAALAVVFNGSQSSDPDGTLASWTLSYGDATANGSGTGTPPASIAHTYGNVGDYTATLTVTDNQGGTSTATVAIHVTKANSSLIATPGLLSISGLKLFLGDMHATLRSSAPGTSVAGKVITFKVGGAVICTATTNGTGDATCGGVANLLNTVLGGGYQASFAGDATLNGSSVTAPLIS